MLALAAGADPPAPAQEKAAEFVPREDMIDAIIHYAASGGCETRRKVFGAAFDSTCKEPGSGGADHIGMMTLLDRLPDGALIELCRNNKIADCEKPREVSKGRSILTFESAFNVEFNSPRATWSPDGRLLLLDNLNLPAGRGAPPRRAAGQLLDPPLYAGPIHDAAWSPDGAYIALSDRKRVSPEQAPPVGAVRLYAAGTRKGLGSISAAAAGCSLSLLEGMAFTADSKALWVLCSQSDKTARAVKLKVPELGIEDSFIPVSPIPGWSESYWEEGIVRLADDLIVTARFRSPTPVSTARSAVQSLQPAHAAAPLCPDVRGRGAPGARFVRSLRRRRDSGARKRASALRPASNRAAATWGQPNRLARLGMHIEARPQPKSRRSVLAVLDSATGATVQEIGPVPTVLAILVSPNETRVAVAGFQAIRFYRVNP